MSSARSTGKPAADVRGGQADRPRKEAALAEPLADEADELIAEMLAPGRWPTRSTVDRFLADDRLERVLALYARAMRFDPDEPAYPWNLASTLNRLGLNDLALGYIVRVLATAERVKDTEWAGPDAHLALAEIALDAGRADMADIAIGRAQRLSSGNGAVERQAARLLRAARRDSVDARSDLEAAARLLGSTA